VQEMNKLGSDISSSEDELLTGEKNYSPIDRRDFKNEFKFDKDDDRMSMSSLSSTEDAKIEEVSLCRSSSLIMTFQLGGNLGQTG